MRQIHRKDSNHDDIMDALKAAGIKALSMSKMGGGWPDAVCSIRGYTCFVEFKSPGEKLNEKQVAFMASWPGDVWVAESPQEAVEKVIDGARPYFLGAGPVERGEG